jgi:hypothetical protein
MSLFDYFIIFDFVMHPWHLIHFTVPFTTALYVRFFFFLVIIVHSDWFVFPAGHVVIPSSKWSDTVPGHSVIGALMISLFPNTYVAGAMALYLEVGETTQNLLNDATLNTLTGLSTESPNLFLRIALSLPTKPPTKRPTKRPTKMPTKRPTLAPIAAVAPSPSTSTLRCKRKGRSCSSNSQCCSKRCRNQRCAATTLN